ncbi:MAG TPA: RDD family protein, partial [Nitrospinota bacterium]|nr:RDD family protein [Nitrospinota bacterium]
LKVVPVADSMMTYKKAFIRYIGYIISEIPLFLGFLWIVFDKDKQGWHDKIAGTFVVKQLTS